MRLGRFHRHRHERAGDPDDQHLQGDAFEGNFVVVEFDYTHGGDTPEDTGRLPFQLSDSEGNVYSLAFAATSAYGKDNDRSLIHTTEQPGVTTPGAAVFEVSPEA